MKIEPTPLQALGNAKAISARCCKLSFYKTGNQLKGNVANDEIMKRHRSKARPASLVFRRAYTKIAYYWVKMALSWLS